MWQGVVRDLNPLEPAREGVGGLVIFFWGGGHKGSANAPVGASGNAHLLGFGGYTEGGGGGRCS